MSEYRNPSSGRSSAPEPPTTVFSGKAPFLLALHDIRFDNLDACENILRLLREKGWPPPALGVIPYAPEKNLGQYSEWLRVQKAAGCELLCHGFRHQADPALAREAYGRLALRLTGGEAELAGLSMVDIRKVLENALSAWDHLGIGVAHTMVPPTWHGSPCLGVVCREMGFQWLETRNRLVHLASGRSLRSWPISFAGTGMGGKAFLALRRLWWPRLCRPGYRLVLHPSDFEGPMSDNLQDLLSKAPRNLAHFPYSDVLFAP